MASVEDMLATMLVDIDAKFAAQATAIAAIPTTPVTPPAPTVDFTQVLAAIADLKANVVLTPATPVVTETPTP